MLLIEQGEYPVAMVKDELLQQNLDSLDRSTRDLLERAGVEFIFRLNDPVNPILLQEQYLRLLEVHDRQGYPITSIPSVIALDQKLQLLKEDLKTQRELDRHQRRRLDIGVSRGATARWIPWSHRSSY